MGELNVWLVAGGLCVGAIFGILVQRFRFCMVAATGNLILINDKRQTMAFVAAFAVAIAGTQFLELSGIVPIEDAAYRNSQFDWFGVIFGGILFGIGASLAGGCAARTLVKTTEGSLHSLVALVFFMLFAAFAQFGFLETTRLDLTHLTAVTLTGDASLAAVLSLPNWLPAVIIPLLFIGYIYRYWNKEYLTMVVVGAVIGLLVVISWYITGVLAQDEFDPTKPSAITMSGPLARFGYILISGKIPAFSFAISFVIGVAVISLVYALATKRFRIETVKKGMAAYAIVGGSLMGIGGILAYGCNIGQGLSGISTLSVESLLAVVSMFAGTALGIKWLEKRM